MVKLTRRVLLKQTSIGVATVGVLTGALTAAPRLAALAASKDVSSTAVSTAAGPLVVYVPKPSSGYISFMSGSQEVVRYDPGLVKSLLQGAK